MKIKSSAILIVLVSGFIAFLPKVQAVSPPPDGGYPGGNTAEGQNALFSQTTGGFNTAVGWLSLDSLTTGSYNTGVGAGTLVVNSADQNTATGAAALLLNTTGSFNTANGALALLNNTTGHNNTAIGRGALQNNTTGNQNTAIGDEALFLDTTGHSNTATGSLALLINNGIQNTANGAGALGNNSTGNANTAIGTFTLFNNTAGSENIALGFDAGDNVTTASEVICIGAPGANVSNSCFIGQIFGATSSSGIPVLINSNNRLGTTTSSKRFKEDIKPMERASEALFALKPVTFRYKKGIDPQRIPQFGLVAEEVEAVNRDLVVRDEEGKPYSVRYDQVNAMLLNEFLKEHRKVEEQQATIAQLKREIETIAAHSKEQDSQIQRVRDQVQMNRPDAGVVVSNH
jgi:trimeric autotransporter adhesin